MTACRNKARGAVVAALAGALTLGAAPVMALADGASLMASGADVMKDATVTYESGNAGDTFTYDGTAQGLVPATVTDSTGDHDVTAAEGATPDKDGYYYFYVKLGTTGAAYGATYEDGDYEYDVKGTAAYELPKDAGNYAVMVGYYSASGDAEAGWDSGWNYDSTSDTFKIAPGSLDGAQIIEDGDASDTTFQWDGTNASRQLSNVKYGVAVDGVVLTKGTDYKVEFFNQDNQQVQNDFTPGVTYKAVVTGQGNYAGKSVETAFKLEALNLESANIVPAVVTGDAPSNDSDVADLIKLINGAAASGLETAVSNNDLYSVELVRNPEGVSTPSTTKGTYVVRVSAAEKLGDDENTWVTGSKEFEVTYANRLATIEYTKADGTTLSNDGTLDVDLSAEKPDFFDASKVVAKDGSDEIDDKYVTISYTDAEGNPASAEDVRTVGTWHVVVTASYRDRSQSVVANTVVYTVDVNNGWLDDADVFVTFDGKNLVTGEAATVDYNGQDWLDKLSVRVVSGGETLTEGDDYEVTVKDKATNKIVDSITDAGTYRVEIGGDAFDNPSPRWVDITVDEFALTTATARVTFPTAVTYKENGAEKTVVPYTGEAIEPVVEVALTEDEDGEPVWTTLDASLYELGFQKSNGSIFTGDILDSMVEEGVYSVQLRLAKGATNYKFASGSDLWLSNSGKGFEVKNVKAFADVPNDEYYTQAVYTAVSEGYVEGMGGTDLFMPNKSMSRAEMVCVLYRMAGGTAQGEDWVASPNDKTYLSRFSDVKGDEFFAQALAWAAKAGVVTGYEDGSFGPADDVTVEQYVTMLARYAKVVGNYEAVDTDAVLGTVADGSQVSEFGQDAVAWAIDNGYLAQGGADIQPQSPVTRGRAVTIAVRYQPAQADVIARPAEK